MPKSRHTVIKRAPSERRTASDGTVFDSIGEMKRYEALRIAERSGAIRDLRRQVRMALTLPADLPAEIIIKTVSDGYPKGRACVYTVDFVYDEPDVTSHGFPSQWMTVYEEYKGFDDPTSRLRRAVAEANLTAQAHRPVRIRITGPAAAKKKPTSPVVG